MSTTKTAVTAHSGAMGLADNSIKAMRAGVAAGADIVEFDLSFNAAGEPVLSHDEPRGGEATLADAYAFLRENPRVRANIDLKQLTERLPVVEALAEEYGVLDRVFFTGIVEDWIPEVRRLCPKIPYYLNYSVDEDRMHEEAYASELAERAEKLGALGLNVHHSGASAVLAQKLHDRGLELSVWTVNEPEEIRRMLALGADNITSRRPDAARGERDKY